MYIRVRGARGGGEVSELTAVYTSDYIITGGCSRGGGGAAG